MLPKSLELKHTIRLIRELDAEIEEIENEINYPILSIHGIGYRMGVMKIAEIDDFGQFDSSDKIPAYAGMSLSTY